MDPELQIENKLQWTIIEYYLDFHLRCFTKSIYTFIHYPSMSSWSIYFNSVWNLLKTYSVPDPLLNICVLSRIYISLQP